MKILIYSIPGIISLGATDLKSAEGLKRINLAGYPLVPDAPAPDDYNAGFTTYTAIWNLVETHRGRSYQSGLFGTWMFAQNEGNPSTKIGSEKDGGVGYSDIEGGSGCWRSNHLPSETPKFHMGGVALNFQDIAEGPGRGKGNDWDKPPPFPRPPV